jgi:hypothetical protein
MSVLDNPPAPEIPPATRVANMLKQQTRGTYQQLVQAFNQGAQTFWRNPRLKPSEIAAALGTDGKEVFELHGKIGALLATVNPAAIAAGAAVVGEFSYNTDGSVTAVDPTPPVGN